MNMSIFIKVNCKNCSKIFLKDKGHYNENLELEHNFYCSRKCESKYKTRKRRVLKCESCGKKFERTPHAISPHNYCSHSCAMVINNQKYPRKRLKPKLKKCAVCKKQYRKSSGNKKYCSLACRAEAERYKPDELLRIIKNSVKKFGRVPGRRDFLKGVNDACVRFFGSWNKAVSAAGFTPNRSHDNRMYKRANAKAVDGHLCDSISEVLIDNWLYENNIFHEKDVHYPKTNYKADWKIVSTNKQVFVEYFGLANDSPRYDRSIKEKEVLCKKQKISLIGIYPKDLYPKIYLDNNLKNKFKKYLTT
jgi:hypothetical protein